MDSKDERHRATVRWTVATASDQAPAGARIESCLGRQRKAMKTLMCKDVSFYLGFEKRIIFIRNLVKTDFALLENNETNI